MGKGVNEDNDPVEVFVDLKIPRPVYNFIIWYCGISRTRPAEFVRSSLMYALEKLLEELEFEGYPHVFS